MLTGFSRMWSEYPRGEADEVKALIGGDVNADWITNTCVIRVSRSFNYAGQPLAVRPPGMSTIKGGDGKRYGIRVREMKVFLRTTQGAPQLSLPLSGDVPAELGGRRGVICFDVTGWSDATGHFDLWDGDACANHGYFERASRVHLWEVQEGEPAETTPGRITPGQGLGASVGAGGVNRNDDVRLVQSLLAAKGFDPGPLDGSAGPATVDAIRAFQRRFVTFPDGRVDPSGRTFRELNGI
jgi:hypothetical protein